jgi:hypothetical protein
MLRLLKFLITGDWHLHRWEDTQVINIVDEYSGVNKGYAHHCKCTVCGVHKSFTNYN